MQALRATGDYLRIAAQEVISGPFRTAVLEHARVYREWFPELKEDEKLEIVDKAPKRTDPLSRFSATYQQPRTPAELGTPPLNVSPPNRSVHDWWLVKKRFDPAAPAAERPEFYVHKDDLIGDYTQREKQAARQAALAAGRNPRDAVNELERRVKTKTATNLHRHGLPPPRGKDYKDTLVVQLWKEVILCRHANARSKLQPGAVVFFNFCDLSKWGNDTDTDNGAFEMAKLFIASLGKRGACLLNLPSTTCSICCSTVRRTHSRAL